MMDDDPAAGAPPAAAPGSSAPDAPPEPPPPVDTHSLAPPPPAPGAGIPAPAAASSNRPRTGVLALAAAVAVAIGGIALKYVLPFVIGTAAVGLLDGVFGGPFQRIPEAQRAQFEQRLEAALGPTLEGLTEAEARKRAEVLLVAGLPRLDGATLADRIVVLGESLHVTDERTCATLSRGIFEGAPDPDAIERAIGALPGERIARWYEINIEAFEAEVAGVPAPRDVDEDLANSLLTDVVLSLPAPEVASLQAIDDAQEVTDAQACALLRALYDAMTALPPDDLAIIGLYDVVP